MQKSYCFYCGKPIEPTDPAWKQDNQDPELWQHTHDNGEHWYPALPNVRLLELAIYLESGCGL